MIDLSVLKDKKIAVIGDIMLDIYVYGEVNRISPEAPVPVFLKKYEDSVLGGGANVAANLAELGANVSLFGISGNDYAGSKILSLLELKYKNKIENNIILDNSITTITKTRLISNEQHVLRLDHEIVDQDYSLRNNKEVLKNLSEKLFDRLNEFNIIIISDYVKGTITNQMYWRLINNCPVPTIIDTKHTDPRNLENAFLITPNLKELEKLTNYKISKDSDINLAVAHLKDRFGIKNILVTKSSNGMTLFKENGEQHMFQSSAEKTVDVSGAGDTVIATMAAMISINEDLETAAYVSNLAGGIVVEKQGTSTVNSVELQNRIDENIYVVEKDLDKCKKFVEFHRSLGKKIGFTNGCYDLLHASHVNTLKEAKKDCDILIVGLNSDSSVKNNKGKDRPIQDEFSRYFVLKSCKWIDYILVFDDQTPENIIKILNPDIIFKGDDYEIKNIAGAKFMRDQGKKVKLINIWKEYSTSKIIEKIKKLK